MDRISPLFFAFTSGATFAMACASAPASLFTVSAAAAALAYLGTHPKESAG